MTRKNNNQKVIDRTLKTAVLIDAFWDRWLVHGIDPLDLSSVKSSLTSIDNWVEGWLNIAKHKEEQAEILEGLHKIDEAVQMYRTASLCYNLMHWIYPEKCEEKEQWYKECLRVFHRADSLCSDEIHYETIQLDSYCCYGRTRIPALNKGCILIIVPIDSSKEEFYQYEDDFIAAGYATMIFDGPGQGQTYTIDGTNGEKQRWEQFMDAVIDFAAMTFPRDPIYLFGTSLGASWALYGSCHPKIRKTVVVSPAVEFEQLNLPSYFLERMDRSCTLVPEKRAIPDYSSLHYQSPIYFFHGQQDQMVLSKDMYQLYDSIPVDKEMMEYEDEAHCVNHKLSEVRQISIQYFEDETIR